MPVTIKHERRDAIYEAVMGHLSGIGDVWVLVESGDLTKAQRLGQTFADDLRLLDDLRWPAEIDAETITLTMPLPDLARAILRLHGDATGGLAAHVSRPKDDEQFAQRTLAATAALANVLGQIADPAAGDQGQPEAER